MSSTEPEVPPQIQTNTATGPCALLNEFFENVPEAIVFVDGEGRVVRANNKFVRMFGYGLEETVGAAISSLVVPAELREAKPLAASSSPADAICSESVCVRKGGQRFEVALLEGALCISGKPVFRYIVSREIVDRAQKGEMQAESTRKDLEYAFQERDRLRLLLDLNNRVAAHCGLRQAFQTISSELRRLFKCECVGLALPEKSGGKLRQLCECGFDHLFLLPEQHTAQCACGARGIHLFLFDPRLINNEHTDLSGTHDPGRYVWHQHSRKDNHRRWTHRKALRHVSDAACLKPWRSPLHSRWGMDRG
jgi:PAS domain S-box-containing protein